MEWYNRTSVIKYIFKYISKVVDKATIVNNHITNIEGTGKPKVQRNEIQEYLDSRYLSACEAMWRTFAFHIHKRKPSVKKLTIHLPGQQNITYKDKDNLGCVLSRLGIDKTMFTEWMELNKTSEKARQLTYVKILAYLVWDHTLKIWTKMKSGVSIGIIVTINPSSGDLYYLRILINVVRGPKSFEEIRTVGDHIYPDFKSACYARGLMDSDAEWHASMDETNRWATPFQLRHMFVTLLIYCEVGNPLQLGNIVGNY